MQEFIGLPITDKELESLQLFVELMKHNVMITIHSFEMWNERFSEPFDGICVILREEVWTPLSREDLRHKLKPEHLGINGSQT